MAAKGCDALKAAGMGATEPPPEELAEPRERAKPAAKHTKNLGEGVVGESNAAVEAARGET